ncbi:MAG: serine/threonine-protein kinase PknK [Magnetococcales bacterium]|nr:serine/threonine-protein kinase PknK [Magnetococcales bacterium]
MHHKYQILHTIYESPNSLIYRAKRLADGEAVVLKVINRHYPEPEALARFRQEYEMTRSLEKEGVVQVFTLEPYQNGLAIVMEDFGARSLDKYLLEGGAMEVGQFLELAIPIAEILGRIHKRRIIHKDINTSNIIWNQETGQIKFIDFGIATSLESEAPKVIAPEQLEGTLAYISPEQTGRMNRDVDYRTDLYSLGVTFFHLLAGRLPFDFRQPMELVHAHIAHPTPMLHEICSKIATSVSAIVAKLMAKDPDDRYQSAHGLAIDLKECQSQWLAKGVMDRFPLGRMDELSQFKVAKKLVGREREVQTLLQAFSRADTASAELVLVAGFSGIGKTVLVGEIQIPVRQRNGFFLSGKYDQFNRAIPYAALLQVCHGLLAQILMASDIEISVWREKILHAVGDNGDILIRFIPELELLIGKQPETLALDPSSAENRFHRLFGLFLSVFSAPGIPLVLFLDDLQWADLPSLRLLHHLLSGGNLRHLLIIGAYRDNEVSPTHPLMTMLADLTKASVPVELLVLTPLSLEHVTQLVRNTVGATNDASEALAAISHKKTAGNPFFLRQFLLTLHDRGLIQFVSGHWLCDLEAIHHQGITDNVVSLMEERIHRLPEACQKVLQHAACIGADFDLNTLATVIQSTMRSVFTTLWPALEIQLIIPMDKGYQLARYLDKGDFSFRFVHDRVQQAAYHLIDTEARERIHYTVGRLLLAEKPDTNPSDLLLRITDHLNLAARITPGRFW